MQFVTIEKVPTWALCYLANGEWGDETEEEIHMVEKWLEKRFPNGYACDFEQDKDGNLIESFEPYPLWGAAMDCVRTAFYAHIQPNNLTKHEAVFYRHCVMESLWDIFVEDFETEEGADNYDNYSPEARQIVNLDNDLESLADCDPSQSVYISKLRHFCDLAKLWGDRITWKAKTYLTAISLQTQNNKTMRIVQITIYGQTIRMYDKLLPLFENACECFYYGEGMKKWMEYATSVLTEDDARKIRHAAFTFMGDEEQPDLEPLSGIKFLR